VTPHAPAVDGKVFVVTGATSGVGKAAAQALAAAGGTIAVLGRNPEKGQPTLDELAATAKYPQRLRFFSADFAELAQVRRLAERLRDAYESIDVLINNAGAINMRRLETRDGFELSFGVNHLAHFLLTGLLVDLVIKAAPSRIINVSSSAHLSGHIDFDDLGLEKGYSGRTAYAQSKLANVLFTRELAGRLKDAQVAVNAVHPGPVQTGFAQNNRDWFQVVVWLAGPLLLTPGQGADTIVYAATAPEMQTVTGEYLYKRAPARTAPEARDELISRRLWKLSEELTGAPFEAQGL